MKKTLNTPDFKDDREAAKWFDENEDELLSQFKQAAAAGTLRQGTLARRAVATSIRLDSADIELAKAQAEKRGLRYQTYLKMILHQHLAKEDRGGSLRADREGV